MTATADLPPIVDERAAFAVARVLVRARSDDSVDAAHLRAVVAADLPAVDAAARAWTGLGADLPPTRVRVVGRLGWVRANLAGVRGAFEPLRDRVGNRRAVVSRVLGAQFGALLGLLSHKVLGQYVLPLGVRDPDGVGSGQLVVVGPNVLSLADDRPELAVDVRRTVLLHEVTHRLQFDSTPWLARHLQGLLDRYLHEARIDRAAIQDVAADLPGMVRRAKETGDVEPLLEVVLTEEQRAVLDEAQGLMSLLEGHGNHVMRGATDGLVADPEAVREHLASRRNDVTSKILTAVGGLDLKRRQYAEGEAFVDAVVDAAGIDGLNRAFERAEHLPRRSEVTDPAAWMARVGVTAT